MRKKPMASFRITREGGKSNAEVLLDIVKDKPAGTVFLYDDLAAALSAGTEKSYETTDVQSVVNATYARLLKEQARALHCVRNVGYRLAPAAHHIVLASDRQSRADKQMLRGMQTLQNVRWDEMDSNQRMAHEGQLLVTSSLFSQMKALEMRQSLVEAAIKKTRTGDGPEEIAA